MLDFSISEDHTLLHDMVDRLSLERHDFQLRRTLIASAEGWHRPFWTQLAELGVLGASMPEDFGGMAGSALATMVIMQAFGRRLVISPYLSTVTCAAGLLAKSASVEQCGEHLPKIAAGERVFAFACQERQDLGDIHRIATTATPDGSDYLLKGSKTLVVGAPWADFLLVVARLADRPGELAAFIVPSDAPNLVIRSRTLVDGFRSAEIVFDNVRVPKPDCVGVTAGIASDIERTIDEVIVALCAEACGSIDALVTATAEYAKTRKQFGQPIGKFQVLQHRMVDMVVAKEQCLSVTHQAALQLDGPPAQRKRAVSAAKAHVGRLGRTVAQSAVQIHGGIGITDELDVTHHFRRIEVFNLQFGSIDDHVRRYAALMDESDSAA